MFDLPFRGDRKEFGVDAVGHADAREPLFAVELRFEHGWYRREAVSGASELTQHRIVLELSQHQRPHTLSIEPLIQRRSNRRVVGGEQHRYAVQGLGKSTAQSLGERWSCHPVDLALAERM